MYQKEIEGELFLPLFSFFVPSFQAGDTLIETLVQWLWSEYTVQGIAGSDWDSFHLFFCVKDIMKSKSNPDFMKKQSRLSRGVRSKVSALFVCIFLETSVWCHVWVGVAAVLPQTGTSAVSVLKTKQGNVSCVCFVCQSVTEQVSWDSWRSYCGDDPFPNPRLETCCRYSMT